MGVDVVLVRVERKGTSPKRRHARQVAVVLDTQDRFARLCVSSSLPMLSRADPYGTLVLTRQETNQFVSEVEAESVRSEDPELKDLLGEVLGLARCCEAQEGSELRLEGD
ncbi:hypothetical protein SaccyDRAFT_3147 [Saccharomonospora cyanea NA-134]|uniref:Uncharacterized protein n=1 Tax=Saccharomonospora cyanea NA-134 TaxID=882082 RepID=H5XLU2_9PSEU|nr:hypothetical protein SaccyDRAFT_3147 [Saccharomonospora cyanea NA-134]